MATSTTTYPTLPSRLSPQATLSLAASTPSFLTSPLSQSDDINTWTFHETLFHSCLRTGDLRSARLCLQRISDRFGATDDRVLGLVGTLDEASAENARALEGVLRGYDEILKGEETILPIEKRRIAVLRSLERPVEAIVHLRELLDHAPTDAEAWGELSSLYFEQGLYEQAIFCLEEVVLLVPTAYNIFARLGEVSFVAGKSLDDPRHTFAAVRYYCRSLELCDSYLRAFYGLVLASQRAMGALSSDSAKKLKKDDYIPKRSVLEQLVEMSLGKLVEITQNWRSGKAGWLGYDEAEIDAAEELIKGLKEKYVR